MLTLIQRVQARLTDLGISAPQACQRAGLNRSYLYELFEGKKRDVQPMNLNKLARVLRCSPAYLRGHTDELMGSASPLDEAAGETSPNAVMGHIVDDETFRKTQPEVEVIAGRTCAGTASMKFRVDDTSMVGSGILPGTILNAIPIDNFRQSQGDLGAGMVVIAEQRLAAQGLTAIVCRRLVETEKGLELRPDNIQDHEPLSANDPGVEIIAVVHSAVTHFPAG